jgi:hypothetical protein
MKTERSGEVTRYLRFAEQEAHGRSALYEALAQGVAADQDVLDFLLTLPRHKRQPNLLFAAVRHIFGLPAGWSGFRKALLAAPDAVREIMLQRATQTNEPARCAVLLPVLARLPQPLALIEVGASAGLCLLPDYYAYDYGNGVIRGGNAGPGAPVFTCPVNGTMPPVKVPQVVWRAGLDLDPVDVSDPAQAAWLETLVWPEQHQRLAGLRAAMRIAASVGPGVVQGDLRDGTLASLCQQAPEDATLVVFHTAVLAYVTDRVDRQAFADRMGASSACWISNETPRVFPDHAAGLAVMPERFLLSVNGAPVAWTDPHGAGLDWIGAA